jgi:hypothetical protein
MNEPPIRREPVADELHLFGGLRAGTDKEGCLFITPSFESGRAVQFSTVKAPGAYRTALLPHGLDIVGWEVLSPQFSVWHLMAPNPISNTIRDWGWIVHSAAEQGDAQSAELSRNVAFSMRAASERLRDISRAYGAQLEYAVSSNTEIGSRFVTVESFDIYLALHAFLAEAASARDYLAAFIARLILGGREFERVRKMSVLRTMLRGVSPTPLTLAVLSACDPDDADGWMAQLSAYRNRIIHDSPISAMGESDYLEVKAVALGERRVPKIYLGMPRSAFSPEADFVDALEHFRGFMLRLLEFSAMVATASPIRPRGMVLTDTDLRAAPS